MRTTQISDNNSFVHLLSIANDPGIILKVHYLH
jgi:hypothetical protein